MKFLESLFLKKDCKLSTFNKILLMLVCFLFFATFFTIPAFSFIGAGKYITWTFTIALCLVIFYLFIKVYGISLDIFSITLILLFISILISTALNRFVCFQKTTFLLIPIIFIFYSFFKNAKEDINMNIIYVLVNISITIFAIIYFVYYRKEIITFSFDRLGTKFGDQNDLALFFSLGMILSSYYLIAFFKDKRIVYGILFTIMFLLSLICGLTTGSKIFIFILAFLIIFMPFYLFNFKKPLFSIILICALAGIFLIIINLPPLASLKARLISFFNTIFLSSNRSDNSTLHRFSMFLCGCEMWLRKPFFGWGSWGFATYNGGSSGWSHNTVSETLCNYGIVGFILFLSLIVFCLYFYFKLSSKKKIDYTLLLIIIIFYLISMISIVLLTEKLFAYLFGVVASQLVSFKPIISFGGKRNENINLDDRGV